MMNHQDTIGFRVARVLHSRPDQDFQVLLGTMGNNKTAKVILKSNKPVALDTHFVGTGTWVEKEGFGFQFEVETLLD